MRLSRLRLPNDPITGPGPRSAGSTAGAGQAGCGMTRRPPVAGREHALLDVARVHDHTGVARLLEHERGEREALRPVLPERRHAAVDDRRAEQAADEPGLALHRLQVQATSRRASVRPATRWCSTKSWSTTTPGRGAQGLDDPAVGLGVVADVVEGHVGLAPGAAPAAPRDHDVQTA